jgi:hypothetical protein
MVVSWQEMGKDCQASDIVVRTSLPLKIEFVAYSQDKRSIGTLFSVRRITLVTVVCLKIEVEVLYQGNANTLLGAEKGTFVRGEVVVEFVYVKKN